VVNRVVCMMLFGTGARLCLQVECAARSRPGLGTVNSRDALWLSISGCVGPGSVRGISSRSPAL
jgi:hypothetical protein